MNELLCVLRGGLCELSGNKRLNNLRKNGSEAKEQTPSG